MVVPKSRGPQSMAHACLHLGSDYFIGKFLLKENKTKMSNIHLE